LEEKFQDSDICGIRRKKHQRSSAFITGDIDIDAPIQQQLNDADMCDTFNAGKLPSIAQRFHHHKNYAA
jgi:hypothetical protein